VADVPPASRLRPWFFLVAVALIALVLVGLRLRRRPAREPDQESDDAPAETARPVSQRKPPRFDETAALRGQVAELTAKLNKVREEEERAKKQKERDCLTSVTSECPFLDPTPGELLEMARCGILRTDAPNLEFDEPDEQEKADPEARVMAQAKRELSGRVRDELRRLHADLGLAGQPAASMHDLMEAIEHGLARADGPDIRRQIARERAGLASPPATPSEAPAERFWRLKAGLGDEYEAALAAKLGPARAHALRRAGNGWSFRGVYAGSCPGDGG
jgi:hypothetical protein